jgi:hypothetical protein
MPAPRANGVRFLLPDLHNPETMVSVNVETFGKYSGASDTDGACDKRFRKPFGKVPRIVMALINYSTANSDSQCCITASTFTDLALTQRSDMEIQHIMVIPPSEMTNAEIGLAFDELLNKLRSLTEEAARRLTNAPDAKILHQVPVYRAYHGGSTMLAALSKANQQGESWRES